MNNDYDREVRSDIVIPQQGILEIPVVEVGAVKLIVFLNGEQVLAEVEENLNSSSITLKNPLGVMLQGVSDIDGVDDENQATVSYGAWLPLAADRDIVVERSSVITICDPVSSLVDSYLDGING